MSRFTVALFVVGVGVYGWVAVGPLTAAPAPDGQVRFNRDIRPILSENCLACHGPDNNARKAKLRLDLDTGLFADRKGGKPVVKGDPKASLVYQRIMTDDEDDVMPPPKSHKHLKPEQKELIRKWIEQGAPWEGHWSFIAPVRADPPTVKVTGWVRNPIDAFVLAKLEEKGLKPAPEADKRTLIRRLSFDLRGLPPSTDEVEAFVNDSSADAYERVVDRMLASPEYGEHRARYWLDSARYADTHGLHFDNYREIWPYRDWVINAFNANKRFDQFTIEQLAGDLLPKPTFEQRVASGFHRCQMTTNEGGTIPEENLVLYTRDRTETTARVFLGLTANCAVCHDHKFDPITQKDFYSMSAFFNNAAMGPLDGNIKDSPPILVVPKQEDRQRYEQLASEMSGLKKQVDERRNAARPEFDRWLASASPEAARKSIPTNDLRLHAPLSEGQGKSTKMTIDGKERDVPLTAVATWDAGYVESKAAHSKQGGAFAELADAGDFDVKQAFSVAIWAKFPKGSSGAIVSRMDDKADYRGWDLWVEGDKVGTHIVNKWDQDALKVVSTKPVDTTKWHHLCITYDGSGKAKGVKVYVDGEAQATTALADKLKSTTKTKVPFKIGQRATTSPIKGLGVQDLRIYGHSLSAADVKGLASSSKLVSYLLKPAAQRSEAERKDLYDWWLNTQDPSTKELAEKSARLEQEETAIKGRGSVTLVMAEKAEAAKAFVLFRGDYDKRRDEVKPATPAALPPMPPELPRNRLGFAQWLLRPEHPLTARVTVNRFWQEVFGTGIVKTTEDFGIMGESPANQDLLDWLAVDFRESGWDVKRFFKQVVMSASYRQAAIATPEKVAKDPENRLLSRGPRFRLDAEVVRDNALAVGGLLVEKIGGPSVRPYQPGGVWEAVAMIGSNTRDYKRDSGESLYRRSLYTFWKRAAPPASMEILNAPSRETCTVRRERTNTPLQALVTMNDPQFVEAARMLAERAMKSAGDVDERLDYMIRRLASRPFRPEESAVAKAAYDDLLTYYKAHAEDAKKLLAVGESKRDEKLDAAEHAAWTMVANQLMNLDEVLNK
jgi:mono/diheme cytochrome c family protein